MTGPIRHKPVIALVAINSQYVHASLAPWCLQAGLAAYAQTPYRSAVIEGTVNEPVDALFSRLIEAAPDMVCLCCHIWNIKTVEALLPLINKELPDSVVVLGGPEISHRASDELWAVGPFDYAILGEGEKPLAMLVDALGGLCGLDAVPGLARPGFDLPQPYVHDKLPVMADIPGMVQALKGRIAYVETSRGCPYACAFCLSGRGEKLREWPLDAVFDQLMTLAQSGSTTIKLVDRTFNANRRRAAQILRFIRDRRLSGEIPEGVVFHFEIAGDLIDEALLQAVASAPAGLFQFEIGLQSMHEKTLTAVDRRTDMALLTRQVTELIALHKAHVHLDLIAGLPGEDLALFVDSFNAAYALGPQALQLGFLKIIHGSAMRRDPQRFPCRFDPEAPYQVRETPAMSAADFATLQTAEKALDRLHNQGRFPRTLAFLIKQSGLSAFELFLSIGEALSRKERDKPSAGAGKRAPGLSLDEVTALVYDRAQALMPDQMGLVRDLMVQDRLSAVKNSVLPDCLKRPEPLFFAAKRALSERHKPTGPLRCLAFLYAGDAPRLAYCDYEKKDPVTGLYDLTDMPLSELGL